MVSRVTGDEVSIGTIATVCGVLWGVLDVSLFLGTLRTVEVIWEVCMLNVITYFRRIKVCSYIFEKSAMLAMSLYLKIVIFFAS